MTTSTHEKVMAQVANKPAKLKRFMKFCVPKKRKVGISTRKCRRCGQHAAHIRKYGLNLCRACFREIATKIGFRQYS
jgi:small subunit ribosomal protein S14